MNFAVNQELEELGMNGHMVVYGFLDLEIAVTEPGGGGVRINADNLESQFPGLVDEGYLVYSRAYGNEELEGLVCTHPRKHAVYSLP